MTSTLWSDPSVLAVDLHRPRHQSIQPAVVVMAISPTTLTTTTCPLSTQTQHIPRLVPTPTPLRITQPPHSFHEQLYTTTYSQTPGRCLRLQIISASTRPTQTSQPTTAAWTGLTSPPPPSPTDCPSLTNQPICSLQTLHQLFPNQESQALMMSLLYLI